MLNSTNIDNKASPLPANYPGIHSFQSGPPQCHSIVTTAITDRYLSVTASMEHQRWEILQAFREGRLACRSIALHSENPYLSQQNKVPRPMYMLLEGCSIEVRSGTTTTISIIDPEPLACYKRNANSDLLSNNNYPVDNLPPKCISSLSLLIGKMKEKRERKYWEVYKSATSGHLKPDGSFSLPKLKEENYEDKIPYAEVVLSQYEKDQIKTFLITDEFMNLSDIFKNKRELEQALNLPCLPLSIFSPSQRKLTVYFEEELNLQPALLKKNEELFGHLCVSTGIEFKFLWEIMKTLPLPLMVETLQTADLNIEKSAEKTNKISSILSDPDHYSIEKFRKLAPDKLCNKVFYQGYSQHLSRILIVSEMRRFTGIENYEEIDLDSFANTNTSREALALFHELLRKGCPIVDIDLCNIARAAPILFNCTVARYNSPTGGGLVFKDKPPADKSHSSDSIFYGLSENNAARTVAIDQAFRNMPHDEIQATLEYELKRWEESHKKLKPRLNDILLTLFYYGANPNPLKQKLTDVLSRFESKYTSVYFKVFGTTSPSEYVHSIISLWQNRETDAYYINWPKKVEIAQQEIIKLKQSIGLPESDQGLEEPPVLTENKTPFQFLKDAFSKPLILPHARDDNETILQILDHYYRRPGPEQVCQYITASSLPDIWKPSHSCSHALRARNNVHWYIELLEKFQVMQFSDEEKTLLSLAMIYHDTAAEDVPKDQEESASASYFKRDLAGHFPRPLLEKVALALESKEDDVHGDDNKNLDPQVRNYLHVLRFGDRMDFIRCTTIRHDYPNLSGQITTGFFDPGRLDMPPAAIQNEAFRRHLIAAMHGAADLAAITGGLNKVDDLREKLDYASRHNLEPNDRNLTLSFERTLVPVMVMDRFLDNMVRIKIAEEAGLHTCQDPEHKQCQADPISGVTRGIHNSGYDLQQIKLPEGMTPLEKMQCEHSLDVLRESTRQAIKTEVERLRQVGIPMNPGTLTQETLNSPEARAVLERRGIRVVREQRPRGFKPSGERNFETLLVPQETLPSLATRANQNKRKNAGFSFDSWFPEAKKPASSQPWINVLWTGVKSLWP